ncbi:MAG: hypothetical protein AAF927_15415 [Bacteroidota bacterium]
MSVHKTVLFGILLFINWSIYAQTEIDFYTQIQRAKVLAEQKDLSASIHTYEEAFKLIDYVHSSYFQEVLVLAKKQKDSERVEYYTQKIELQQRAKAPVLKAKVDSLFEIDQQIRMGKYAKAITYYWRKVANQNPDTSAKKYRQHMPVFEEFERQNASNIRYLLELMEQNSYLGEEIIGASDDKVEIIMLHFDKDEGNRILKPILNEALAKGQITPLLYAQILDRHLYTQSNQQTYWTWPCANKGEKLAFTEEDIPQILSRRESIGIIQSDLRQIKKRGYWLLINEIRL